MKRFAFVMGIFALTACGQGSDFPQSDVQRLGAISDRPELTQQAPASICTALRGRCSGAGDLMACAEFTSRCSGGAGTTGHGEICVQVYAPVICRDSGEDITFSNSCVARVAGFVDCISVNRAFANPQTDPTALE